MDEEKEKAAADAEKFTCDWLLQNVVNMANAGFHRGITLTTAAGLVTGTAIAGDVYLDLFAEQYCINFSDDDRAQFLGFVEGWKKPYSRVGEEGDDSTPPVFIHLKDAKIFHPTGVVPSDGMLWRGRIDAIIGFTVGTLESTKK